jgi:hypothetical protein
VLQRRGILKTVLEQRLNRRRASEEGRGDEEGSSPPAITELASTEEPFSLYLNFDLDILKFNPLRM